MNAFPAGPARQALEKRAVYDGVSVRELGETLRVSRSTLQRLYERDWLRYDAADLIASVLGQHPSELWDNWFDPHDLPRPACADEPDDRPVDDRASRAGFPPNTSILRTAS